MDLKLTNKVALVGGGSKGLGRAIALALASEGARVAIVARGAKDVQSAAEELSAQTGSEVIGVAADLAKADGAQAALDQTRAGLGPIDILVTNTGGPRPGKFDGLKEADWDAAYDLLLKSALRLVWGALPDMRARKWGRIIGVTSISVKEPIETLLLSNVFRVGVTALYKSLSREVGKDGITVNTVLPGLTDTERLRQLYGMQAAARKVPVEQVLAEVGAEQPLGRLNTPDEMGRIVAFLASELASGVNGCAIPVDGGQFKGLM